ncbi:MAG: alpha/beta fold hydrolase [Nitrospinota bacterium]
MVKKELYPFTSHFLDIDGQRLHYLDEGTGEPVLMLHGNPTWSFYFRNLVSALRENYRVIVPDHIGCGLSDKPGDKLYDYTLKQRIDDIDHLLKALNIDSGISLVLHDWGGMIGMGYAVRSPEKIKKIVLLNTGAFHLPPAKRFPFLLRIGRDTQVGAFLIRGLNAFVLLAASVCPRKRLLKDVRDAYLAPYNSWKNRIATLRFVQDIPLKSGDKCYDLVSEVQQNLHRFKSTPVMLLWGMKDFVFDKHFFKKWLEFFPDAETHAFENGGHYILEDEGPECLDRIKEFLQKKK